MRRSTSVSESNYAGGARLGFVVTNNTYELGVAKAMSSLEARLSLLCSDGVVVDVDPVPLATDWKFFAAVTSGVWRVEDKLELVHTSAELRDFLDMYKRDGVLREAVADIVRYFGPTSESWILRAQLPSDTDIEEFRRVGAIAQEHGHVVSREYGLATQPYKDELVMLGVQAVAQDRDKTCVRICRELGDSYNEAYHAVTGVNYCEDATLEHVNLLLTKSLELAEQQHPLIIRVYHNKKRPVRWLPAWESCGDNDFSPELHKSLYEHIVKVLIALLPKSDNPEAILEWLTQRRHSSSYPSPAVMHKPEARHPQMYKIELKAREPLRAYWSCFATPTKSEVLYALTELKINDRLPTKVDIVRHALATEMLGYDAVMDR